MRRLLTAFEARDQATIRTLLAVDDDILMIGSDAREWHHGSEAIKYVVAQLDGMPTFRYSIQKLEAFENGSTGWAAADTIVILDAGHEVPLRFTGVFSLDNGVWRMVHWHASEPKPNDPEIMGVELTENLGRLLDSLEEPGEELAIPARLKTSTVTVVFTDIEESTRRKVEIGDESWNDIISRHFTDLATVAHANQGVLVKTLGDGAMLAFDSARNAAASALEIQEATVALGGEVKVRVGIHTGDAIDTDGDYFGQTVDKAARITAAAAPGQILVSDLVRGLMAETSNVAFGPSLHLELKGIPGTATAYPNHRA